MPLADLSQLTAIIATSDRRKSLTRLVRSLRRHYPKLRVLVADYSMESQSYKGVDCLQLPAETGRSAARNALLARIRTPYFLQLDDRCELRADTSIEELLSLVADDSLDLAGGDLVACQRRFRLFVRRRPQPAHGIFEIAGDQLTLHRGHRTVGEGFAWCDFVHDFYVARTQKIRSMGGWDPELKSDEREEFFFRGHRHGLRVGINPVVSASLWKEQTNASHAIDKPDLTTLAVAKMGLVRMTNVDGRTFKAPRRAMAA